MSFLDSHNFTLLCSQMRTLDHNQAEIDKIEEEISKGKEEQERLETPEELERIAREQFLMKEHGEDIFLIKEHSNKQDNRSFEKKDLTLYQWLLILLSILFILFFAILFILKKRKNG